MASGLREQPNGEFAGTERFHIQRRLGAGGMGVVYLAFDRERKAQVALKTLRRIDAAAIYRLKQEFRQLADVTHPNLIGLHELVSVGDQWFFTMEFVEGTGFYAYVRELGGDDVGMADTVTSNMVSTMTGGPPTGATIGVAKPQRPIDALRPQQVARLRTAARQLAEGVFALHQAGKLHRDLKPSNVMVTRDGRVVILDFGLVTELDQRRPTGEQHVVGTAAYMAPEQGANLPLSESSDWYAVGVMLYEALTGRLPFVGGVIEVLMDKQKFEPPPPRELVPDVSDDLNALCVDLLRRQPEARPSGRDVLRRLGSTVQAPVVHSRTSRSAAALLVGREKHLQALEDAIDATRRGSAMTVYVHGASGMGKSALVQRFLDGLSDDPRTVVLSGRCYERESVPYKALDSVVDALSRHLMQLPQHEARTLLPRHVLALARLFPVLRRVGAVAEAPRPAAEAPDPHELRKRAFAALRELLARLADRQTLVVYIDDLQWGDTDSAALLADLMRPPDPPPLMLLACYRSEDAETSPLLRELLLERGDEVRDVSVGPLAASEARDLAVTLLGRDAPVARALAERVARESGGNPFFVDELVRHLQAGEELEARTSAERDVSLEEVLRARLLRLPPRARRLLEVVAVAGRPIKQQVAGTAAELPAEDPQAMAILRAGHLVRTRGTRDRDEIETYHDRIREAAVRLLAKDELRETHRQLAFALEASQSADAEALAVHFRGAEMPERAGEFAAVAAAQAAQALAFDRAARLYRLALELRPVEGQERRALEAKLGDALANAGRGLEAAQAYIAAALGASAADGLEMQRRAAEQLLRCGHMDQGLDAIHRVLAQVGMSLAPTPKRALVALLARRAHLRLRGLSFRERDASEISAAQLVRIDTCWSVALGLSVVDTIRGADFQTRHLLLALSAGEPYRVARALAVEAGHAATAGKAGRARSDRLLADAEALGRRIDHPHAIGMAKLSGGIAGFLHGSWKSGNSLCAEAETLLRDRCTGVAWELTSARAFRIGCLVQLGELGELQQRVGDWLRDAEDRGDLYAATSFRVGYAPFRLLAADDVDSARADLEKAIVQWSQHGFHVQHYNHMLGTMHVELYGGAGERAWRHIEERWPALEKSLLLRIELVRHEARVARARSALAAAAKGVERERLLAIVAKDIKALRKEDVTWAMAWADVIEAGLQHLRGQTEPAIAALAAAEKSFATVDMPLHAACALRRRGELTRDSTLIAAADAWMAGQKIVSPARMSDVMAPGFCG